MSELLWVALYLAIGFGITWFMWFNSGSDLTVGDILTMMFLGPLWPLIVIIFVVKEVYDRKPNKWVIWKRGTNPLREQEREDDR